MIESEINVPQNCWEYKECPIKKREQCPVYKFGMGEKCWTISYGNKGRFSITTGDSCFSCHWFNKYNPEITP